MNWIKFSFLLFLTIAHFDQLHAQEESAPQRFKLGLKLGPMTSQMSGDGLGGFDKFGAVAGAQVRATINDRNSVSLGMEYMSKGSRAPIDTINHTTFAYRLHYIQIPINWHYTYSNRLQFHSGLYAGYLIHQSVMANKLVYAMTEYGGQPGFNDWDLGVQLGVQFVMNDNNGLILEFGQSVLPIRDNPAQTNQYSFYEGGNYNSTVTIAWLHSF
jgi:hypothetical protein